mmetsp:Transcript_52070/g.121056  ORF Transcript_52070/g.121056 Transcript_52070/m.121056 type:complete len:150 (-) Transcript_52070:86-535(-)
MRRFRGRRPALVAQLRSARGYGPERSRLGGGSPCQVTQLHSCRLLRPGPQLGALHSSGQVLLGRLYSIGPKGVAPASALEVQVVGFRLLAAAGGLRPRCGTVPSFMAGGTTDPSGTCRAAAQERMPHHIATANDVAASTRILQVVLSVR